MLATLRVDARWLGCAAVVTFGLISSPSGAQRAVSRLRAPTAVLSEGFGRITGVRELSDGRVLVSDGPEKRLVVADLATQVTVQVGRNGNGPGEYAGGLVLHALGGDSTLATDASARRWLLLAGDRIVKTIPPDDPAVLATQAVAYAADGLGRVLTMRTEALTPGVRQIGPADSGIVVLVGLATGKAHEVAKVRRVYQTFSGWEDVGGRPFYFLTRQAFAVGEAFNVAADGWVAIARLDPYRVDWHAPDGRVIRGAPIPYDVVKVTEREKQFYRKRYESQMNRQPNLPAALTATQRAAVLAGLQNQWNDFPATIPPFEPPSITAMSTDAAFIRRIVTADAPNPVFDAIDRRGRLIAHIQLAAGERLIAAGRGCVYIAAEDEDGLDHLRRHPWP